jgi:sec-independent protein translocase protein TatB
MFGLSFAEILIIAVLALILLGPDQLPSAAKTLGKALRELKRTTDGFKDQIEDEVRALDLEGEQAPKPTLVPPMPAMPVPGRADDPPEATPGNVPGLEAALAEPDPAPGPAQEGEPAAGPAPATPPTALPPSGTETP